MHNSTCRKVSYFLPTGVLPGKLKKKSKKKKSRGHVVSHVTSDLHGYHSDSNSSIQSDHSNPTSMSSPVSPEIPVSLVHHILFQLFTERQNFRLVQFESIYRRQNKSD